MRNKPLSERITQPTPEEVRAARKAVALTQAQATALISTAHGESSYRVWQSWETPAELGNHRPIPLLSWEAFLLLTGQHPLLELKLRKKKA